MDVVPKGAAPSTTQQHLQERFNQGEVKQVFDDLASPPAAAMLTLIEVRMCLTSQLIGAPTAMRRRATPAIRALARVTLLSALGRTSP